MENKLEFIKKAIEIIESGIVNRLESPDKSVSVYKIKDIIRIDIKHV